MSAGAADEKRVILVTGGTGLVGKAVETVIGREQPANEEWVYLSSKDGDLRCAWGARARRAPSRGRK